MKGTNQLGAACELIVSADLIRKGHDVYRALSPSAPFDLVSHMDGVLTRVEVRTAQERRDGSLTVPVKSSDNCDLYAFVCGDRIEYVIPDDIDARRLMERRSEDDVSLVCIICETEFVGHPSRKTCSDACKNERRRLYNTEYARTVRRA